MNLAQLQQQLAQRVDEAFSQFDWPFADDDLPSKILHTIASHVSAESIEAIVLREQCVKALGPLRLKYMADDAPVDGFRLLEKSIVAIDDSFNDEALQQKTGKTDAH